MSIKIGDTLKVPGSDYHDWKWINPGGHSAINYDDRLKVIDIIKEDGIEKAILEIERSKSRFIMMISELSYMENV